MKADFPSNNRALSLQGWGPIHLKHFCWILHKMSKHVENSGLAILNPMGKGHDSHFTQKLF